jgi:hypothetical protein
MALERPYLPGQTLLSGFAISPSLSPSAMVMRYGRTHLARGMHAALNDGRRDALTLPVAAEGQAAGDVLVCHPARPRLWWLRRGGALAIDVATSALLP